MKKGEKGYHWAEVATCNGTYRALVHDTHDYLCFHDRDGDDQSGWYTVTHVPSGNAIANCATRERAMAVINVLTPLEGLALDVPPALTIEGARAAIARLVAAPVLAPESRPVPEVAPIVLTPVYRPGFTPSRQVIRKDRELALLLGKAMAGTVTEEEWQAWPALLEEATTLRWREEIKVRMPGLEDEAIPKHIPKTHLLDGTPLGHAGFLSSRLDLDTIGDEIAWLAERIVFLAREYEGPGWEKADAKLWREYGIKFATLIKEGWMEWTACAAHFHACSEEEKADITSEMGFVGNQERGYHALGEKTFLRHAVIRRAVADRDRINTAIREDRDAEDRV